jgi:hypothetical protein
MPPLTRWFLRSAIVCLIAGLGLGVLGAGATGPLAAAFQPLAVHLLVVGWATQMIFGVAFWMFPRPGGAGFGDPRPGWTAFASLNLGLLLRALAEPAVALGRSGSLATLGLAVSAASQLAAVLLFAGIMWRRIAGPR